jgi:hypothetical protein
MKILYENYLPRPKFEPWRFSGGVNNSALERNNAKRKCFYLKDGDTLIVPGWMRAEFEAALAQYREP